MLDNYKHHLEGLVEERNLGKDLKGHGWMFAGEKRGTSLNLPNLVGRVIIPLLVRCKTCGAAKHLHTQPHQFVLDESVPKWRGWRSFRRSLATNLYGLGVKPQIIAAIIRHSDVAITLQYYIATPEAESRDAMDKLQDLMRS